jgi:chemotaxis response regulator CheB
MKRDVVVVACSVGGVAPVQALVTGLPADFSGS